MPAPFGSMFRRLFSPSLLFPCLLIGCTPLGGWLYDDPQIAFSRLTERPNHEPGLPFDLVLIVYNCNDFDLTGTHLDLSLSVGGVAFSKVSWANAFNVKNLESTNLTVPLAVTADSARELEGLLSAGNEVELHGEVAVNTPVGRRLIPFAQRGTIALSSMDTSSGSNSMRLAAGYGHWCRRGHSEPLRAPGRPRGIPIDPMPQRGDPGAGGRP